MTANHHPKRPRFAGPLYSQVADAIRERIIDQEWQPGRPFPNESELARDFAVSVGTMRKALSLLEEEGLIVRQQGRGTFVTDPACDNDLLALPLLHIDGKPIDAEYLQTGLAVATASSEESVHLQIFNDEQVIRFSRCLRHAGQTVALETLAVPKARFTGLENETDLGSPTLFSIYHRKHGILVARIEENIFVCRAGNGSASHGHDDVTQGPHLCISRIALDAHDVPVEWSLMHVRDEATQLVASRERSIRNDLSATSVTSPAA